MKKRKLTGIIFWVVLMLVLVGTMLVAVYAGDDTTQSTNQAIAHHNTGASTTKVSATPVFCKTETGTVIPYENMTKPHSRFSNKTGTVVGIDEVTESKEPEVKAVAATVPGDVSESRESESSSCDIQAAMDCAETWWNGQNPAYHACSSESGNCADFVPPCLMAGGLNPRVYPNYHIPTNPTESAYIRDLYIQDTSDSDGDGYYEWFSLYIEADTDAASLDVYPVVFASSGESWGHLTCWTIHGSETDWEKISFDLCSFSISSPTTVTLTVELRNCNTDQYYDTEYIDVPVDYPPEAWLWDLDDQDTVDSDGDGYKESFSLCIDAGTSYYCDLDVYADISASSGEEWSTACWIEDDFNPGNYYCVPFDWYDFSISSPTTVVLTVDLRDCNTGEYYENGWTIYIPVDYEPDAWIWLQIQDAVDSDGDGYYESFSLCTNADTNAASLEVYEDISASSGDAWSEGCWTISPHPCEPDWRCVPFDWYDFSIGSPTTVAFTVDLYDCSTGEYFGTEYIEVPVDWEPDAWIYDLQIQDAVDSDGDGYYESFFLCTDADTNSASLEVYEDIWASSGDAWSEDCWTIYSSGRDWYCAPFDWYDFSISSPKTVTFIVDLYDCDTGAHYDTAYIDVPVDYEPNPEIRALDIQDAVDSDGDGYYESFSLCTDAITDGYLHLDVYEVITASSGDSWSQDCWTIYDYELDWYCVPFHWCDFSIGSPTTVAFTVELRNCDTGEYYDTAYIDVPVDYELTAAWISGLQIQDAVDSDGDGYYESFSLCTDADTYAASLLVLEIIGASPGGEWYEGCWTIHDALVDWYCVPFDMSDFSIFSPTTVTFAVDLYRCDIMIPYGRWYVDVPVDCPPRTRGWTKHNIDANLLGAEAVYVHDINADGSPDVVAAGRDVHDVVWYEAPSWTRHDIDTTLTGATGVYVHDMDSDGDPDVIATGEAAYDVVWYEAPPDPSGTWIKHSIDLNLNGASGVYIHDMDSDGDPDVVAAGSRADTVVWYEAPSWTPHYIDTNLDGALAVYVHDMDADGDPDVVAAGARADTIVWYEAPSWSPHYIDTSLNNPYDVYVYDINADGKPDVIAAGVFDDDVVWYEAPSWTPHYIDTKLDGALGVYVHDMDADGDPDVIATGYTADHVVWYEAPTWTKHYVDTDLNGAYGVYVCDIDSDGNPDVIAAGEAGEVVWYRTEWESYRTGYFPCGDACNVFDDHTTEGTVYMYGAGFKRAPNPAGTWTEHEVDTSLDLATGICVYDIDSDGNSDVVAAGYYADDVVWYEAPTWAKHSIDADLNGARGVYIYDIDSDGDPDVVATGASADDLVWYEAPTWAKHSIDADLDGALGVYVYDIDSDGNPDIVATGAVADDVMWYEAPDDPIIGAWTEHEIDTSLDGAHGVHVYDIDSDGNPDIIATGTLADDVVWYEAPDDPVTGTWTTHFIDVSFDGAWGIHVSDIDSDGNPDVVATGFNVDDVVWYEAPDDPCVDWAAGAKHYIDASLDGAGGVYVYDIDADGNPDVVAAGYSADDVVWYEAPDNPCVDWLAGAKHYIHASIDGAREVYVHDIDADGNPDVVACSSDNVVWYKFPQSSGKDYKVIFWEGTTTQRQTEIVTAQDGTVKSQYTFTGTDGPGTWYAGVYDATYDPLSYSSNLLWGDTFKVQSHIRAPVAPIDFGSVATGSSSYRTTTIHNDGSGALTVNDINIISGSDEFTYVGPTTLFCIEPGNSQVITISFAPTSAGEKNATFNVNSNDPDEPDVTFDVSGSGTSPIGIQIELKAGWNMVSVPLALAVNSTDAVFPGVAGVFTWYATDGSYYEPAVIEPEKGYWVAVIEDTTITINGNPIETWTTNIKAGWNMIGSVNITTSIADPNDNPDSSVIPPAYWWDAVGRSYVLTTDIEPGKGYWVASVNDCVLTL
jgi:hypothetical protein